MKLFGYKVAHLLSPKRWWMVIKFWLSNKFGLIPIKQEDSIAFAEIVLYRSLTCPQCTFTGKCIGTGEEGSGCGCDTNGLYGAMDSTCDLGSWFGYDLQDFAYQWEQYKKLEGIEFELKSKSKL